MATPEAAAHARASAHVVLLDAGLLGGSRPVVRCQTASSNRRVAAPAMMPLTVPTALHAMGCIRLWTSCFSGLPLLVPRSAVCPVSASVGVQALGQIGIQLHDAVAVEHQIADEVRIPTDVAHDGVVNVPAHVLVALL